MPERIRKILKFYNVILASASPRRAELIKKIPWLRATVFPSEAIEFPYAGGDVTEYVCNLAVIKARDVFRKVGGTVIGADTVVYAAGKVLGKPCDKSEAEEMFKLLCGRTHEVITGIAVMDLNKLVTEYEKTYVTFNEYDSEIVGNYINTGAPFDKAGGYGLQDEAISPLVRIVKGDKDNVIGLPVRTLEKTLKEFL